MKERVSLQEIWRLGCEAQPLHPADQAHFETLAKNRFHTFLMGMRHATAETGASPVRSELLIKGMVNELEQNPGLEHEWFQYNFANSTFGLKVSERLTPSDSWLTRLKSAFSR